MNSLNKQLQQKRRDMVRLRAENETNPQLILFNKIKNCIRLDVANKIGTDSGHISRIMTGKTFPGYVMMVKLAKYFDTKPANVASYCAWAKGLHDEGRGGELAVSRGNRKDER